MFCKDDGPGEMGLGIDSDINDEINTTNFIQLAGLSGIVTIVVNIQSVQSGEGFDIFGSNSNGVLGMTLIGSGSGSLVENVTVNMSGFTFLDVTASSGNVLLDTVTTPVPEPATLVLMGSGLLFLGFLMRRRFASVSC